MGEWLLIYSSAIHTVGVEWGVTVMVYIKFEFNDVKLYIYQKKGFRVNMVRQHNILPNICWNNMVSMKVIYLAINYL